MTQARQKQKIKGFQEQRTIETSAQHWSGIGAGEFTADLQNFFFSRSEKIRPEQISRVYANHKEEARYLMEKIQKALPNDEAHRYLFLQLEDHLSGMEAESNFLFYQQGFSDGVRVIMQSLMMNGL